MIDGSAIKWTVAKDAIQSSIKWATDKEAGGQRIVRRLYRTVRYRSPRVRGVRYRR